MGWGEDDVVKPSGTSAGNFDWVNLRPWAMLLLIGGALYAMVTLGKGCVPSAVGPGGKEIPEAVDARYGACVMKVNGENCGEFVTPCGFLDNGKAVYVIVTCPAGHVASRINKNPGDKRAIPVWDHILTLPGVPVPEKLTK
jgi:hypothetical protein